MKGAYINETGPPEKITYGSLPKPRPHAKQVLVQVGAVAVNPIDTYIRGGLIAMDLPKPYVVGCDLAGKVVDVGREVFRLKVGDRVWGSNQGMFGRQGTFAEFVAVDECWLYPTPAEVSDTDAAAVALVGITAHLGLFRHVQLRMGETICVTGGSGGVGACVVRMAKIIGARVITTAGSPEKAKICRQLGAEVVVNYKRDDVSEAVRKFAPQGVEVWWETTREPDLRRAVTLLAPRGRLLLMAGRDATPPFPIGPFYTRDCRVLGFAMFNAPPDEQRKAAIEINRWLALGYLRPRIDRVLPLSEAAAAHRLQEESTIRKSGKLAGKIVLTP